MKLLNLFAFSLLCIAGSVCPDTALAAAVAHDNTTGQALESAKYDNQKATLQTSAENKTPVTNAIVNLGIPLSPGLNYPAPGLKMELYTKVADHITVETLITIEEDEPAHPLVAQILAIIGYEKTDCGYFYCTEPKASKSDRSTTIVSIKKPYGYYQEVHIKLRTLLDPEQAAQYIAILRARRDAKK